MSFLLNPQKYDLWADDAKTREVMTKTIEFFEEKGLARLRDEDYQGLFYEDFLQFWKKNEILATLLTPAGYGDADARFDLSRVCEYNELLGFYSPAYQYGYQVSILGVGPLWMGDNEEIKHKAGALLKEGAVFAFGLSERTHGADIYANEMKLTPLEEGTWRADGNKYYIGNANKAAIVSTMGRYADTGEFVFFAVNSQHHNYVLSKQIKTNAGHQAYVGEYDLIEYPITKADILSSGTLAWDTCLSTINIGKFQLGFSSIGCATHAFYEALDHAHNRTLYSRKVTDFPHIKKAFIDSYARLVGAKLYALRSLDYFRSSSAEDRRYLLFNPIQKYKVTSQGEKVIALLQNVIATKSFEQETFFASALTEIGMLPRLEGTTHVNLAQIIKFIPAYLFKNSECPDVPRRDEAGDDTYLFKQTAGKLTTVTFPDYSLAYEGFDLPNIGIFREKIESFRQFFLKASPDAGQSKNIDYMLNIGEMFTLIVYAQLILENLQHHPMPDELVDRIFSYLVRDFSEFALSQIANFELTPEQENYFTLMMKKPIINEENDQKLWQSNILPLVSAYSAE